MDGCALILFRDTLELPRRVTAADSGLEVPIEDLLPALNAWIYYASHKLWLLSLKSFSKLPPEILEVGELAKGEGFTYGGFNTLR